MTEQRSTSFSRVMLVILFVGIFAITIYGMFFFFVMGAFGAGWTGKDVTTLELIYGLKSLILIATISAIAAVGQIRKKRYGYIASFSIALSFLLFGISAFVMDKLDGKPFNYEDLIGLLIIFGIGTSLFLWIRFEMKRNNHTIGKGWITIAIISVICVGLFLIDSN